jgi:hypothetical protein
LSPQSYVRAQPIMFSKISVLRSYLNTHRILVDVIIILWRVGWYTTLIRRILVRMIGFISSWVTHSHICIQQYSVIAHLHTFHFTVAHALGLISLH